MIAEPQYTLKHVTDVAARAFQSQVMTTDKVAVIAQAVKDAATASNRNDLVGLKAAWQNLQEVLLDPRVKALRDQHFKLAEISPTGEVKWELKEGVVAKIADESMNKCVKDTYDLGFLLRYRGNVPEDYLKETGPRKGQAVFGVLNSENKNHDQMASFLQPQGISLSSRYNSLVSLRLHHLLTGSHPLANGVELRDACGILYSNLGIIGSCDDSREEIAPNCLALGTRD